MLIREDTRWFLCALVDACTSSSLGLLREDTKGVLLDVFRMAGEDSTALGPVERRMVRAAMEKALWGADDDDMEEDENHEDEEISKEL